MQYGVVFPQTEIGASPAAIQEFAQAAEDLGFEGIVAYDHVLGADPSYYQNWKGAYALEDLFHEIFVLFGYMAAVTQHINLITGVVILPQRQTALVAKQAAEIDVLSGGRLRLGIGIGWNPVEYEALGENFHNRGRRSEEQIELLRKLWTEKAVTYQGRYHKITAAGLNPLPVQRPIPIWFGGGADQVLRRVARLGDGWMPLWKPEQRAKDMLARLHEYLEEAGRASSSIAIAPVPHLRVSSMEQVLDESSRWKKLGATHIYLDTMRAGLASVKEHIQAIEKFRKALEKIEGGERASCASPQQ